MRKFVAIGFNTLPIFIMIGFIPFIGSDYTTTALFILTILTSFLVKRERNEIYIFIFGFLIMTFFEYIFISTGVETFQRNTLFGVMPLWLPFLWGYGFVAIKRSVEIINS